MTQRDIVTNAHTSSYTVRVVLLGFKLNWNLLDMFWKNTQISSFVKIRPVGAELLYADGLTEKKIIFFFILMP